MSKVKEIEEAQILVSRLLVKYPECRDNSSYLILTYWYAAMKKISGKETWTTADLVNRLRSGRMTQAESISRISRKLQREYPHLRGKLYEGRHKIAEEVRARRLKVDPIDPSLDFDL